MQSDYKKVCEFNKCFDFPVHTDMEDEKCRKLRLDLIEEELLELKQAYQTNDVIEEQDACADILYVAYGMAYTYKIDFDIIFKNKYNLSEEDTIFKKLGFYTKDKKIILDTLFELFSELKKYTDKKDIKQVEHYLHDLIYYVYNFEYASDYDGDKIFDIVHNSNMSKLCKSESEAQLTVEDYLKKYNEGNSPYESPYYYKLDNGMYVVKNKSTGKALKSINYIKVKL